MRCLITAAAALGLALAGPAARADVVARHETGFVSRNTVEVSAKPEAIWTALLEPATWWSSEHTFSGDAANLSLDPRAGGCFCEVLPASGSGPVRQRAGGVEHMRVVNVQPGRAMRLVGALGPLQAEAVQGVLTITLKPTDKGTRILFEYVAGGYMRFASEQIAPLVDRVILEQTGRLALKVDPRSPVKPSKPQTVLPAGPPAPQSGSPKAAPPMGPVRPGDSPIATPSVRPEAPPVVVSPAEEATPALPRARQPETIEVVPVAPSIVPEQPLVPPQMEQAVGAYLEQDLLVRPWQGGIALFTPGSELPMPAEFATRGLEDRFAAQLSAARKDPANKGKAAFCACMGQTILKDDKPVFSIISARLEMR